MSNEYKDWLRDDTFDKLQAELKLKEKIIELMADKLCFIGCECCDVSKTIYCKYNLPEDADIIGYYRQQAEKELEE